MKEKIIRYMLLFILVTAFYIADAQSISKITMQPMNVIYIVDTAATTEDISSKMEKSYGRLFMLIGQQQLKPGKVMAIYRTSSAPWIFDVAVEVDKAPGQQTEGIQFKTSDGGDAIVLHFKGPYEHLGNAYRQIDEWLRKNNKQRSGAPMEVYLNEPATVKDKNELRTDVYQLIKQAMEKLRDIPETEKRNQ
jgi:effector-binding domain-containing protein